MKGNAKQTGTPTPDNPVMPEFVGVRTAQIIPKIVQGGVNANNGNLSTSTTRIRTEYVPVEAGQTYTISGGDLLISSAAYYLNGVFVSAAIQSSSYTKTITVPSGVNQIAIGFRNVEGTDISPQTPNTIMLNLGSTALPYEPHGYKLPLTCAGQTVPVYLGQTQTVRRIRKIVFDGTENWRHLAENSHGIHNIYLDLFYYGSTFAAVLNTVMCSHYPIASVSFADETNQSIYNGYNDRNIYIRTPLSTADELKTYLAQQYANGTPVTIWYVLAEPETAIVNEPLAKIGDYADELHSADAGVIIPTAKGQNTLTVDTTLPPSEVSITGKIKPI